MKRRTVTIPFTGYVSVEIDGPNDASDDDVDRPCVTHVLCLGSTPIRIPEDHGKDGE